MARKVNERSPVVPRSRCYDGLRTRIADARRLRRDRHSPALIMGLVGSLAFFLLEVMYRGQYEARLQWTVFFFVFGAVLVARISMIGEIASRYWIYAPILGSRRLSCCKPSSNTQAVPRRRIEWRSTFSWFWWCCGPRTCSCGTARTSTTTASRRRWACSRRRAWRKGRRRTTEDATRRKRKTRPVSGAWIARYQRYRAKKKRRRVLGVWVVYFALATLPIFGLGQALIDPEDVVRRRVVFWLMSLYAGCALGPVDDDLLSQPAALSAAARRQDAGGNDQRLADERRRAGAGAADSGVLLPRPNAEYRLDRPDSAGQGREQASKFSPKKHAGKGEDDPGDKPGDTEKGQGIDGKDVPNGGRPRQGRPSQRQGGGQRASRAKATTRTTASRTTTRPRRTAKQTSGRIGRAKRHCPTDAGKARVRSGVDDVGAEGRDAADSRC